MFGRKFTLIDSLPGSPATEGEDNGQQNRQSKGYPATPQNQLIKLTAFICLQCCQLGPGFGELFLRFGQSLLGLLAVRGELFAHGTQHRQGAAAGGLHRRDL